MIFSKTALIAIMAALSEQASAFNAHRHLHQQVDKRAFKTDWVTVWQTVYVTAGSEGAGATEKIEAHHHHPAKTHSNTIISTSVVVAPTSTVKPVEAKTSKVATTMDTAIREQAVAAPSGNVVAISGNVPYLGAASSDVATTTTSIYVAPPVTTSSSSSSSIQAPPPAPTTTSVAAPPPSSSSAAPPASTSVGSGSGSGSSSGAPFSSKRGLCYNDALLAKAMGESCKECSWAYNWGDDSQGLDDSDLSYVPMLWGPTHTDNWDNLAEKAISGGAKALFSFNECDNAGQANMDPVSAAKGHVQYMNKYAGKALIGAPAITNSGETNQGLSWLEQFVDACDGLNCHYDFCNVHWYSPASAIDTLFEHIEGAHKACAGKPVWITEFAPTGSDDEIAEFLKTAIPKLEALDYVHAYSYFMVSVGSLFSSSTALSTIGQVYADLTN